MQRIEDLPHISIHFQEQTSNSLEFLIHLVRPKAMAPLALEKLPKSLYFFRYTKHLINTPFSIEIEVFSIKMRAALFDVRDTINLLYARRYIAKQLELIIGPFRDYNGGLFEKQQDHFEMVRLHLSSKIPNFDLFAEKVFYALHPFEKWFSLKIDDVEDLMRVFSTLIQNPASSITKSTASGLFTVVKTENRVDFLRFSQKETDDLSAYAQLTIGNYHYECFSGNLTAQSPVKEESTLRLVFQEGLPPSLNPHYSAGDMRCRLLNKMLFEGLTRLNHEGKPELAGARSCNVDQEGKVYTFHLRKAQWSNGEKVTAFDYATSWKWTLQDQVNHPELLFSIKNAKNFREKKCLLDEVGVRAIDPETLQIELEERDPQFLYKLAQPFYFPLFGSQREPKWFNGPYLVESMNKNGIKLGRNPYFWQSQTFEQVEVEWIHDIHKVYSLFKEGKVDWIGDPTCILSIDQVRELKSQNLLRSKKVPRRFCLQFNTKHPILRLTSMRRALSLAIDRTHICKEIFPYSIPAENRTYSKELAAAFFEEALRELKLNRKTFPTLTFSYSDQTRRDELASYLQTTWQNLFGIQIKLQRSNWNTFRSQLEHRNFEICGTIQDTLDEGSIHYLQRFEGANSWNFSQWSHLVYRELLIHAKKQSDPVKQNQLIASAKNILAEKIPFSPLFDYVHLYALNPRFECTVCDAEGCVDFSQGKLKV
jgi:oligopeptide transport system substrate-binding protein